MPDSENTLGASIRRARKRRGLTIQQVAKLSGLSISFISQLERDLLSPSVNSLQKISRALGIQIGGFFEGQGNTGRVVRAGERPRLIYPNRNEEEYLLTPVRSKKLQVLYYRLKPGATSGDTPYSHDSDEECGIVLRGSLEVSVNGEVYILNAGDAVTFDSHLPHTWRNMGDEECEALWVVTPPGY
ncbi:MAG: cupin domain-containing protein [Chloroflexi bacterium]|nr:cupin domain-containing protein [Chloroflexota bacterium]